jgi:hypothetical protein
MENAAKQKNQQPQTCIHRHAYKTTLRPSLGLCIHHAGQCGDSKFDLRPVFRNNLRYGG